MEANHDFAKGFMRGDKSRTDILWDELMKKLNSEGPPQKNVSGWKKVWQDWKSNIKKKLAHNKNETRATGGGPYNIIPITTVEDTIAKLTGLYRIVEGINGSSCFGVPSSDTTELDPIVSSENNENINNASNNSTVSEEPPISCRHAPPRSKSSVEKYMEAQQATLEGISTKIDESLDIAKENRSSLKRTYRAIESLSTILQEQTNELKRHHVALEKLPYEKNETKKQILQIERTMMEIRTNGDEEA